MNSRLIGHKHAIGLMFLATLLWSSAGYFSRKLEVAGGVDMTFLRSGFCALSLYIFVGVWRGFGYLPRQLMKPLHTGGWVLWASGLCWAIMFTLYMLAFSITSVANVLITLSLEPFLSALLGWLILKNRVGPRTWLAIAIAGMGMAWIFYSELDTNQLWGTAFALFVPLCAAINWILIQKGSLRLVCASNPNPLEASRQESPVFDMLPSVFVGACLSALITLPFIWPLQVSVFDIGVLAGLGVFQLALPCLLVVVAAKRLPAHELAMLAMLEVIFGVLWVWVFAGEKPSPSVIQGGLLVLGAVFFHEVWAKKSPLLRFKPILAVKNS